MKARVQLYVLNLPYKLVYMLQATEYQVADYLRWFWRAQNFDVVARRKGLDLTQKAKSLLVAAYSLQLVVYAVAATVAFLGSNFVSYLLAVVILLASPYLVAHLLILPLWLGQLLIQKPKEVIAVRHAKKLISQHPAKKIAIAGSYGKTTFRETLKTILSSGKEVAAPPSSYNTKLGLSMFAEKLTGKEEVVIFELGESHSGDIAKLCKLTQPDIGVITGINEAHLATFKSLDQTVETIFELTNCVSDGIVYKNGESELVKKHSASDSRHVYTSEGVNGWQVLDAKTGFDGTSFVAKKGKKQVEARSKLLGLHQVGPLVAMIDLAANLGLSAQETEAGIRKTESFEHRLQPQKRQGGVKVIDDTYNGSPDGARAAINLLKDLSAERKVYVTPGFVEMGSRHKAVHRQLGKELAAVVDLVVLIENSATPYIAEGLEKAGFAGELMWFDDPVKCYQSIDNITRAGDVVVLQNDWPEQYL